jgi:hypothetical protein
MSDDVKLLVDFLQKITSVGVISNIEYEACTDRVAVTVRRGIKHCTLPVTFQLLKDVKSPMQNLIVSEIDSALKI